MSVAEQRCSKCDRLLFPGQSKYFVVVRIVADPDSVDAEVMRLENGLKGLFQPGAGDCPSILAEDGDVELSFTLCGRCRREYGSNPLAADFSLARRPAYLH